MKRNIIYAAVFFVMSVALTSCEVERCKVCKQVTYENGNVVEEGNEAEYCGGELITIELMGPVTVGNRTTQWECR